MRGLVPSLLICLATSVSAGADPEPYTLDRDDSVVGFSYTLSGAPAKGTMPVLEADVVLDLDTPSNSRVNAVIDAASAQAGLFFATEAMKGVTVLYTDRFPTISFRSTRVTPLGPSARIDGEITIRNVTRPITLAAQISRPRGTDSSDHDRLSIRLTGRINRADFGATGFPELVGDTIRLDILTRVDRVR